MPGGDKNVQTPALFILRSEYYAYAARGLKSGCVRKIRFTARGAKTYCLLSAPNNFRIPLSKKNIFFIAQRADKCFLRRVQISKRSE